MAIMTAIMRPLGIALRGVRAGVAGLATQSRWVAATPECIRLHSPAFGHGVDLSARFTADGAGLSPPLIWTGVPQGARSLLLLVEDADIPFAVPLVHALAYAMPPELRSLGEGAIPASLQSEGPDGLQCGRNGFGRAGWLPPAPPPGHGPHHYAFQMLALDTSPNFPTPPSRHAALAQARGHLLGWGVLFGVYERA